MTKRQLIKRVVSKVAPPRVEVTLEGLKQIRELVASGHGLASVARRLTIGHTTLKEIAKRDDAVKAALDEGREMLSDVVSTALLKQGLDGYSPALMFIARMRCGWTDGAQSNPQPAVTIVLPAAQSNDEYMAMLARANALPALPQPKIELEPYVAPDDGIRVYTSED